MGGGGSALSAPSPPDERAARRALVLTSPGVFLASATWCSGTAAVPALRRAWGIGKAPAAWLTIALPAGFITGTFFCAILNLSDVFNARRVFFASAVLGAVFNAGFAFAPEAFPAPSSFVS